MEDSVAGEQGERLKFIEVTRADIALADKLCAEVIGRTMDELPPQTRRLLGLLQQIRRTRSSLG